MRLPAQTRAESSAAQYRTMIERIRYEGAYPTYERAEETARTVLTALGGQLDDASRTELAALLPPEAARLLHSAPPASRPLTGWAFVKQLAEQTGRSLATTRWDVGSVLTAVPHLVGPAVTDRAIAGLPSGYALLFGRPQLVQAA
ncbi:DUF2267 domain-containing protein [Streptomyces bohaiensis]|uniref:DUF2267 domain-containing protein n=1 Tax=Streptomyces bohaiensis TaxID=1431344 RepID=A0ABX1CK07_9ACTN|nr:DUF2267 domain-containing protein [Streptomyces bohaiensis]NJQ16909.1 DUF2267 domain-containing protein [Streptomyces bohaiensis]